MDIMFRESLSDFISCSWWTFSIEITFIPPQNVRNIFNCYMSAVSLKSSILRLLFTLQLISAISGLMNTDINISAVCACGTSLSTRQDEPIFFITTRHQHFCLLLSVKNETRHKAVKPYRYIHAHKHTHTQTHLLQSDIKHCCKHYGNARVQMPSNGSLLNSI